MSFYLIDLHVIHDGLLHLGPLVVAKHLSLHECNRVNLIHAIVGPNRERSL